MTQVGRRAKVGGQGFHLHVPQRDHKACKGCKTAPGLVWKGGKYDLRDGSQETQVVFPNIFPATHCETICKVHSPPHFHRAFMLSGHLIL